MAVNGRDDYPDTREMRILRQSAVRAAAELMPLNTKNEEGWWAEYQRIVDKLLAFTIHGERLG